METSDIPILEIENFLIASIQVELHDRQAVRFKDGLLNKIYDTGTKGVLLDMTALQVVDSFIARIIGDAAEMAKLMGAKVVVTGLQPAVAITLIELGIELDNIVTALNLEKGLGRLRAMTNEEEEAGG
jgi:rsbT antagonist protein RsbS